MHQRTPLYTSVLIGSFIFAAACTRGSVVDSNTQDPLGDVSVNLFTWPPPSVSGSSATDWDWPLTSGPAANYQTLSYSSQHEGYNWAFDGKSGDCQPPEDVTLPIGGQWYRFKFTKPGYEPMFRYMYHDSYSESCQQYDCQTNQWVNGSCASFDEVEMHSTSSNLYELLPDIFVDPRDLDENRFQCVQMQSLYNPTDTKVDKVGLRVSTGVANVGNGKFEIEQNSNGVFQNVALDGATIEQPYPLTSGFEHHPTHDHVHVKDWAQLRLLEDAVGCDAPPGVRPSSCDLIAGGKLSFCAVDFQPFDREIMDIYGLGPNNINKAYTVEDNCDAVDANGNVIQGLTAGWEDEYGFHLSGQVIVLGGPPNKYAHNAKMPLAGDYRIEAEWDPTGVFPRERDKTNNRAQTVVTIPEFNTGSSTSSNPGCDSILDCTGGHDQPGSCKDYYRCQTHSECADGLSCQVDPTQECMSNADCDVGVVCNAGHCARTGGEHCTSNAECDTGFLCDAGHCARTYCQIAACSTNSDCAPGTTCQSYSGLSYTICRP